MVGGDKKAIGNKHFITLDHCLFFWCHLGYQLCSSNDSLIYHEIFQTHFKENLTSNRYIITLLSIAVSLVVNVINGILGIFIRMLSGFEKHQTVTSDFISVAKKLSYAQFTNTAILTLLVQIIVSNDNEIKLWTAGSWDLNNHLN